jgi:DNA invertase Pin-like site-specific DNA recombinase
MKKLILRASTGRQELSAEIQKLKVEERFGQMEAVYLDQGVKGDAPIEKRPALMRCLDELKRGDELYVFSFSRLARSTFLHLFIEKEAAVKGVSITSLSEEDASGGGPEKKMFRTIIAAVAEYEKSLIAARSKAAKDTLKAKGRYCGGRRPYGTRIVERDGSRMVELEPNERKVIDRMLVEKKAGRSIRLITEGLNADSIISATGSSWHYSSVKDIVKRELAVEHYEKGGENEPTAAMESILDAKRLEMAVN